MDISWASFDSMIYTTDYNYVSRINPETFNRTAVPYKGIFFSPDGKYYFAANYEGNGFGVYERVTNKNVSPPKYEGNPMVNFHSWMPEGSVLVVGDMFRAKEVIDISTKNIEKRIEGELIGYDNMSKEFLVLKHKRYFPKAPGRKIEKVKFTN